MAWHHRFRNVFRRNALDRQIDEELAFHIAERVDELVAAGMSEPEARSWAQRQFGSRLRQKEETRDVDMLDWLESVIQDLRYGIRTLAANPVFTATAVLSLALGIGANIAIFNLLNAVMLRSLPVEDPARLVQIDSHELGGELTNPIWEYLRDRQQAFSGVLAYSPARFDLADGGESHFAQGLWVSGEFFKILGVAPLRGRVFTAQEDRRGAAAVAVISYRFWKRNFPHGADVIGKMIRLDRHQFEIVGVTPPWFTGLDVTRSYDVAIPITCEPILHTDRSALDNRSWWWLNIVGRLAPGETERQAQSGLRAIAPALFQSTVPQNWPIDSLKDYLKSSFYLKPASTGLSQIRIQYRTALLTLMGAVGLVLMIACANIANLLLARATVRQHELSVRIAMGASRLRVVRQLMTESFLLSLFGTAIGFVFAMWGGRILVRLMSATGHPLEVDLSPDFRLLAFTVGTAVLTSFLFGLLPALRATRGGLNQALKENERSSVQGSTRFNSGKALIAGQVALSLVLLIGAGLFLGTLRNLLHVDLGFDSHNVLLVNADFQQTSVSKQQRTRIYSELLDRLRTIPGVLSAASSSRTPITNVGMNGFIYPEGYQVKSKQDNLVFFSRISPSYFATMRTPLLMGRDFTRFDTLQAPKAIILNKSTARHFFGSVNPIGKTIGMDKHVSSEEDLYRVIGVVGDSKYQRVNEESRLTVYVAMAQNPEPDATISFILRGTRSPDELIPTARKAIAGINRDASLEFKKLETQVADSLLQPRAIALLSLLFGALALLLAGIGLYGTTTYGISRRRREIGIRVALGAQRWSVVWLILHDIAMLLAIGILIGLAASLALGRIVTSLLYGIQPNDPIHLAAAVILLAVCTISAAYLPALRAARLDPMEALREE